ncbi:D-arabinono-14-lactone oxidase [Meyerozyma sp. JA9]|nr:D-arabinono-14-lactone oxidase [Meyerozyma sp. JA9]
MIPNTLQDFATTKVVHRTWAGTFQCKPQAIFQPRNEAEVAELIKQARLHGKTIMTVGSGHSPSDMTMTSEWLCNLDKMDRVLKKEEFLGPKKDNSSEQEVKFVDLTVEAGCRIYQLNEYAKKNQLAIQNLGSISEQSIAGLISTGTHGSSKYHGLVCEQLVSITIMNSEGKPVECSSTKNPELFRASLLSLGKIGIIVKVTLRTIPRYTIKSRQEVINFSTLIKLWDEIWLETEFIRIWWFPYSEKCLCWRASKSDEPLSAPRSSWYGTWSGRFFYESLLWVAVNLFPRITPWVEKFVFKNQYGSTETIGPGDVAVQDSVDALNMDCLFSQFVNEWSAPLSTGVDTLLALESKIKAAARDGEYFVHAPIEVRCSNVTYSNEPFASDETGDPSNYPSESWLATRDRFSAGPIPGNNLRPYLDNSPYGLPYVGKEAESPITNENLTLFINATMYRPFGTNPPTRDWYQDFEDIMMTAGGKPHWAKNFLGLKGEHATSESTQHQVKYGGKAFYTMLGFDPVMRKWFGKDLEAFNKVRRDMDPEGVFLSGKNWMERNGLLIE